MITKTGKEIVEDEKNEKSMGQSLRVGLAAGIAAPLGTTLLQLPLQKRLGNKVFNQGMKKGLSERESSSLISSMLGSRKDIKVVDEPFGRLLVGPHFNPLTRTVNAPKDTYILAHELGHASGLLGKNRVIGQAATALTHGIGGPVWAPLITSLHSAQKSYNRETGLPESEDSKILGALNTASQIGTAGQLAEEAQASIRGINAIGKLQGRAGMLHAAKALGPAFGTYALAAVGSHAIAPWLGGMIGKWIGKNRMEREREE